MTDGLIAVSTLKASDGATLTAVVGAPINKTYSAAVASGVANFTIPTADLVEFDGVPVEYTLIDGAYEHTYSDTFSVELVEEFGGASVSLSASGLTVTVTVQLAVDAPAQVYWRVVGETTWNERIPADSSSSYGATIPHSQSFTVPEDSVIEVYVADHVGGTYQSGIEQITVEQEQHDSVSSATAVATSSSSITVSWPAASASDGGDGYAVYRDGLLQGTLSGIGTEQYIDTQLQAETLYSYSVVVVGTKAMSEPQTASATTESVSAAVDPITAKFLDVSAGDDSNSGTMSDPWATLSYAQSQLVPGDTLAVRAGTVREVGVEIDSSGTSAEPILIRNWPGESVVFDSSLAISGWTVDDAALDIYAAIESSVNDTLTGWYWDGEKRVQLIYYEDKASFESTIYDLSLSARYVGPGIFYENGRVKIRTTPVPDSFLDGAASSVLFDPNTTDVQVSNEYSTLAITASYVSITNVETTGAIIGADLKGTASHITISDCDVYNPLGIYGRDGASDITIERVNYLLYFPEYLAWTDLKGGATHFIPASHWSQRVSGVNLEGVTNVMVRNCHYSRALDGGVWTNVYNGTFTENTGTFLDDLVQIGTDCSYIYIHTNDTYGAGPSHNGKDADAVVHGTKYIYNNETRSILMLWGKSDPDDLVRAAYKGMQWTGVYPTHTSSKIGTGDPWKLYNNTFYCYTEKSSKGLGFTLWKGVNETGATHWGHNNVFYIDDSGFATADMAVDDPDGPSTNQSYNNNSFIGTDSKFREDFFVGVDPDTGDDIIEDYYTVSDWQASESATESGWDTTSTDSAGGPVTAVPSDYPMAAELNAFATRGCMAA